MDPLDVFRSLAVLTIASGAAASIVLMLIAGSRQPSLILVGLFTGWVLSPFVGLGWAGVRSKRWPTVHRAVLYASMFALTLVSLAMYDGIIPMPPGSRPAAAFLVVPFASWVFMAMLALAMHRPGRAGGNPGRQGNP